MRASISSERDSSAQRHSRKLSGNREKHLPTKTGQMRTIPVMQRRRKTPEAMRAYPTMASYVSTSVVSLPKAGVNSESAASKSTSAAEAVPNRPDDLCVQAQMPLQKRHWRRNCRLIPSEYVLHMRGKTDPSCQSPLGSVLRNEGTLRETGLPSRREVLCLRQLWLTPPAHQMPLSSLQEREF